MRLNRFLATAGLGSRRGVEQLIQDGKIRVNGHVVTDLATQVQPGDIVKAGQRVLHAPQQLTAALHKPKGYVCTASDERDRRTIFDLLPPEWPRVFHVGRLDMESEGLLLVTNDGDLANALTHPSHHVDKEYEVTLDKPFQIEHREKMLRGIRIEGGLARAVDVHPLPYNRLRIVLQQGLKRQIRHMCYHLGYEVLKLLRIRIGPVHLGALKPAHWRPLDPTEISALKRSLPTTQDSPPSPARPPAPAGIRKPRPAKSGPTKTQAPEKLRRPKARTPGNSKNSRRTGPKIH
ncbi:MAG: hypothetical protein RLZZ253_2856 [Verrucomicrobiota bacterium]